MLDAVQKLRFCAALSFVRSFHGVATITTRVRFLAAVVLYSAGAGCGGDAVASAQPASYVAVLKGTSERPRPTSSTASGSATFTVSGTSATYFVSATGFAGALTVGHIHLGSGDVTGPVIVPFDIIAQSGTVATGSVALDRPVTFGNITITGDSLRRLLDTGQAYVNLHSAAYPDGDIRGQVVRQ